MTKAEWKKGISIWDSKAWNARKEAKAEKVKKEFEKKRPKLEEKKPIERLSYTAFPELKTIQPLHLRIIKLLVKTWRKIRRK